MSLSISSEPSKSGRKRNDQNSFCQLCKKNLRITYGQHGKKAGFASNFNLFWPSEHKDTSECVIAIGLSTIRITIQKREDLSEIVCRPCRRKLIDLCETASKTVTSQGEVKRKLANLTPSWSPGGWKQKRISSLAKCSPRLQKELFSLPAESSMDQSKEDSMPAKLNVDDMDMSPIKIMVGYLSGTFREHRSLCNFRPWNPVGNY